MITAHPSAPEGQAVKKPFYLPSNFLPTHAILCRNTAPLVAFAFGLIQRGVGCKVMGREIGAGLVTLIKKIKADSIEELEQKLIIMRNREIRNAEAKGHIASIAAIEDKFDCLNIFLQHAETIDELCRDITNLFDESKKGLLTLATIHKAKGLEWETVWLLDFHKLLPSKWAAQGWQLQQEKNLQYVAVTRAKLNLFFIETGNWRKEGQDAMKLNLDPKQLEIFPGCPVPFTSGGPRTVETNNLRKEGEKKCPEVQHSTNAETPCCNPPPTFNPDAVASQANNESTAERASQFPENTLPL